MAYIEFNGVVKEYPAGDSAIRALDGASFTADEGELSVILGRPARARRPRSTFWAAWTPRRAAPLWWAAVTSPTSTTTT